MGPHQLGLSGKKPPNSTPETHRPTRCHLKPLLVLSSLSVLLQLGKVTSSRSGWAWLLLGHASREGGFRAPSLGSENADWDCCGEKRGEERGLRGTVMGRDAVRFLVDDTVWRRHV